MTTFSTAVCVRRRVQRMVTRAAIVPVLLSLIMVAACSRGADKGDAAQLAGRVTAGRPEGLFFMTRYSSFSGSLEKAAWYFSSTGEVYRNLETGFSAEDLAAHAGPRGRFEVQDDVLAITWADGRTTKSDVERDGSSPGFTWDMGIFSPVEPFADAAAAAGRYEGGESLSRGGSSVAMARSLELRSDGTYRTSGVGSVQAANEISDVGAGSQNAGAGAWSLDGYTITLTAADGGSVQRKIAFPYDLEDTPVTPDWMFLGGMLYKQAKD